MIPRLAPTPGAELGCEKRKTGRAACHAGSHRAGPLQGVKAISPFTMAITTSPFASLGAVSKRGLEARSFPASPGGVHHHFDGVDSCGVEGDVIIGGRGTLSIGRSTNPCRARFSSVFLATSPCGSRSGPDHDALFRLKGEHLLCTSGPCMPGARVGAIGAVRYCRSHNRATAQVVVDLGDGTDCGAGAGRMVFSASDGDARLRPSMESTRAPSIARNCARA